MEKFNIFSVNVCAQVEQKQRTSGGGGGPQSPGLEEFHMHLIPHSLVRYVLTLPVPVGADRVLAAGNSSLKFTCTRILLVNIHANINRSFAHPRYAQSSNGLGTLV